jgi:hypothetical protein
MWFSVSFRKAILYHLNIENPEIFTFDERIDDC